MKKERRKDWKEEEPDQACRRTCGVFELGFQIFNTVDDDRFMISFCWHYQVKKRTANDNSFYGSHVMQYGDLGLSENNLFLYIGTNPANDNYTFVDENSLRPATKAVNQRDADLVHFWHKVMPCFSLELCSYSL